MTNSAPMTPEARTGRAMGSHQSHRAKTTTWLTPPHIIDALGKFDVDPCAAPGWKTADRHIILPEDGLIAEWEGRVWLNPPYGNAVWEWLDKLATHGNGTALIFARTETAGFVEQVWNKATALHFLHGRLHFHYPDGTQAKANAGAPSVLVAYGDADAEKLRTCGLPGTYVHLDRAIHAMVTIAAMDEEAEYRIVDPDTNGGRYEMRRWVRGVTEWRLDDE